MTFRQSGVVQVAAKMVISGKWRRFALSRNTVFTLKLYVIVVIIHHITSLLAPDGRFLPIHKVRAAGRLRRLFLSRSEQQLSVGIKDRHTSRFTSSGTVRATMTKRSSWSGV